MGQVWYNITTPPGHAHDDSKNAAASFLLTTDTLDGGELIIWKTDNGINPPEGQADDGELRKVHLKGGTIAAGTFANFAHFNDSMNGHTLENRRTWAFYLHIATLSPKWPVKVKDDWVKKMEELDIFCWSKSS